MIDLHCHALWGVDDGAALEEQSINICKLSSEQGVEVICATPHFIIQEQELDKEEISRKVQAINKVCQDKGIDIKVVEGCECYMHPLIPQYIEENKLITINKSKYLLIEFPMEELPAYSFDILYRIQLKGITPIIAHPERYSFIRKRPSIACELVERGCLMQCNAGSLMGYFGKSVQHMAFSMFSHNLVHLIGSDAHTDLPDRRGPCIKECMEQIGTMDNVNINFDYLRDNANRVLDNINIPYMRPIEFERNKGFKKNQNLWSKLVKMFAN